MRDYRAELSVIGTAQTESYRRYSGRKTDIKNSNLSFKFGDHLFPILGNITAILPTTDGVYIELYREIVNSDVPMMFELEVRKKKWNRLGLPRPNYTANVSKMGGADEVYECSYFHIGPQGQSLSHNRISKRCTCTSPIRPPRKYSIF